ncbi:MAG: hypothetical protein KKC80_03835 [Candidatus Margulisbacteria bacterium]|nr:hypothetical protein [Candidatus Margulisiibacteriota bacterium]MBU1617403.1 hypothetical protein [Candidatus Margulisiibacteriota bacterium]
MYKVVYQLPVNQVREITMSARELKTWLRWSWLRERIIKYSLCRRKTRRG